MSITIHNATRRFTYRSRALLFALLVCTSLHVALAANLTFSPLSVTTKVGKTFSIDLVVTNNIESINAVSGLLSFPQDTLEVVGLSKKSSFISLWAEEPNFSNTKGSVSVEGVALNPGFDRATGKVITVTFKALQAGNISITIKNGAVLANDGNATDVLKTTGQAMVYVNEEDEEPKKVETKEIVTPAITSPTHPDSAMWYARKDASFEWKVPADVTAVRTVYSDKETSDPSKVYDPPITNRSFSVDKDGVLYMAVQFKNGSGWGPVGRFKFQVDSTAPEKLTATFPDGAITTNQTPALSIVAEDSLSKVVKLTLSIDNGQTIDVPLDPSNLYRLPKQNSGNHTIVVGAVDAAGNITTTSLDYTIQTISPPVITEYTKKVDFDHHFKITGATYPNATIEILLTGSEGELLTTTATSSDTGAFVVMWDKNLPSGIYEMKARVLNDGRGSVSDYTDTRVIVVERMILLRIGIFVMNWLSVILIVIIAAASIAATLWYAVVSFARWRRRVKRNLAEVENTLHANVRALRKDTEEFHDILVKAERKRDLTKEETTILKRFKKRLEITEKEIEKKLEKAV